MRVPPVSPLSPRVTLDCCMAWSTVLPGAGAGAAAACPARSGHCKNRVAPARSASRGDGAGRLGPGLPGEMWRAVARQLTRSTSRRRSIQDLHQGQQQQHYEQQQGTCRACRRWKSSGAAPALDRSPESRWRAPGRLEAELSSPGSRDAGAQRLSCLEESVFALDTALHTVLNLPWIATHGLDEFPGRGGEIREFRSSHQLNAVAEMEEAAEELEEKADRRRLEFRRRPGLRPPSSREKRALFRGSKDYAKLFERQKKAEVDAWNAAVADYEALMEEMCRKNLAPNLPFAQSLLLGWFEPLRDAIEREKKAVLAGENFPFRSVYGPFLLKLPSGVLAVITMHKLMGLCLEFNAHGRGSVRVVAAAMQIAEAVENENHVRQLLNKRKPRKGEVDEETAKELVRVKRQVKNIVKSGKLRKLPWIFQKAQSSEPWGEDVCAKVGARLVQLLVDTAVVTAPAGESGNDVLEHRPAFRHTLKMMTKKKNSLVNRNYGVIEMDQFVYQELGKSVLRTGMPYMPMLVPPIEWTGFSKGSYLYLKSAIMRTHGSKMQVKAIKEQERGGMTPVFEALDTLGTTAWRINKRILDVVEELWRGGGGVANLVDQADVDLPKKPDTEDKDLLTKFKREAYFAKRINGERHSLRCDMNLKLQVAQKMAEEECFFYPHNVDFRGRAYPMHPHLNHLGADVSRGILEFAEGRALGHKGLRWLKISLANLFGGGVDKLAFDGRIAFVDNNMEKVFDSAARPLDGERWWLGAENPFQCLAVCMDLRDAFMTSNPQGYVSHLPVHQDGSCNGLQHYAALGRDRIGAASVNLIAGHKPADVYMSIAKRVHAIMEKDALGPDSRFAQQARVLIGQVDRKLVKQTVMTSVYGVTFIGARGQIMSRLMERNCLPEGHSVFHAANYAAKVTLSALGQMFKEARCIMGWLGDCAKIIASQNMPVQWKTPLGLPVVQPYRREGRHTVKTSLQVLSLMRFEDQPISAVRQRSAFPPNFVHSLDGTHMMMTAVACGKEGLSFAGVHDSYWTHAADVDRMNQILREKFVELYSKPILEDLLKSFKKQFPDLEFPDVPQRGDLDLKEVLVSPYFFN